MGRCPPDVMLVTACLSSVCSEPGPRLTTASHGSRTWSGMGRRAFGPYCVPGFLTGRVGCRVALGERSGVACFSRMAFAVRAIAQSLPVASPSICGGARSPAGGVRNSDTRCLGTSEHSACRRAAASALSLPPSAGVQRDQRVDEDRLRRRAVATMVPALPRPVVSPRRIQFAAR